MKILVLGENITDVFIYCDCERLSPESKTTPVLKPIERKTNVGGAANVVRNLSSLSDFQVASIHQSSEITKTRYIVDHHHVMRLDENDECEKLTAQAIENQLTAKGLKLLDFEAIIISSYNKGFISEGLISNIRGDYKGLIFVDTKDKKGSWCEEVDFIKINEKEWRENFGGCYQGNSNVFVTKGAGGVDWVNEKMNIPTEKVKIASVVGAGDVFLAAFATGYLKTKDVKSSLMYANRAASFSVTQEGVYVVKEGDLK